MIKVRRLLFYAFAAAALVFCFESTKGMAAQTDIRCEYDGNGTMLVHGNGVLQWTAIEESTEDEVGYGIKKVVIQEGITEISAGCFSGDFTDMTELKLPNSLQKIGNRAFKGCKKLKKVVLPSGLSEIPKECFSGCKSLTKIVLNKELTAIRKDAFKGCERLEKLTVPENLDIWENPIQKCSALKKIVNHSTQLLKLDTCQGNKAWYVGGKKAGKLASGKTAISKGKKFKISYRLLGGEKSGNLPSSYRYGSGRKLTLHVRKKGFALLGWYNSADKENPYYQTSIGPSMAKDIILKPFWVKYKLKNIAKNSIKISIDDRNAVVPFGVFDVRYSKRRDMANAKYFRIMDAPKVIHGLKKNQRYYFEIAYVETEDDDDDYESIWVGRRNIVIRK